MSQVEINTFQNVKIEYQLASVGQRVFAFALDTIVLFILLMVVLGTFSFTDMNEDSMTYNFFTILAIACLWFYSLAGEVIGNGQTIGKWALGIKVVKLNGDELEFYDYFSRWSVRLFDIYFSAGVLAMLLIAGSRSGQRLGDIIAGTAVIRKRNVSDFRLEDILSLNNRRKEDYDFSYPNARRLSEKDVILIKNTLFRYHQFKNSAHIEILKQLTDKVTLTLDVDPDTVSQNDEQRVRFLNKLVSEYIILTR